MCSLIDCDNRLGNPYLFVIYTRRNLLLLSLYPKTRENSLLLQRVTLLRKVYKLSFCDDIQSSAHLNTSYQSLPTIITFKQF